MSVFLQEVVPDIRKNIISNRMNQDGAGFWGDSLPNAFGYTVALVNYGKYIRSDTVELRKLENYMGG